jgi:hypothetical protein
MSIDNEDIVKAFKCTACGGDIVKGTKLEKDDEDDEDVSVPVATCIQCGKEYDRYTKEYYTIFSDFFNFDKDASLLKLGLKGNFRGKEYEIIGRIRYQEEDEYEKSTWNEWVAVCSEGSYHYFSEENGTIMIYTEYNPESIDLESGSRSILFEGKRINKEEAYVSRIVYAEGELPWKAEIGESSVCYDFKKDGNYYSIEHSSNEVTVTRGERISYGELIEAFDIEEYRQAYKNTVAKRKSFAAKKKVYLLGILISLGAIIYGCSFSEPVGGIENTRKVLTRNIPVTDEGGSLYQSSIIFGPFNIEKGDALYSAQLSVDESVQQFSLEWQSFRLMLVPETGLNEITGGRSKDSAVLRELFEEVDVLDEPVEVYSLTGDFWDEEGRDSDGYWHEAELSVKRDFVLESAGKYYFYLELYNNKKRNPESVNVALYRSTGYRYFVIAAVIMVFLFIVNFFKSIMYNELPFQFTGD